jgi:hypothetical protein
MWHARLSETFMQRINAQPSFTDLTLADLGGKRSTEFFTRCEALIPFQALADLVANVFVDANPKECAPPLAAPRTGRC